MIRCNVFPSISIMVVQADDGSGDFLGLSRQVYLGLNGASPCELVDFEV